MDSIKKNRVSKFLGATLIASGTSIGAGMLALPVLTGLAGFWPAVFIYALFWLVVTYASLLLLEINLTMGYEANLLTMTHATLGSIGRFFAFITYIFLFYSVSVAYLAVSGSLISSLLQFLLQTQVPDWVGITLSLFIYIPTLYTGTKSIARVNTILVAGIVVSYVLLISLGSKFINPEYLLHTHWKYALMGIPVIATSFTFQNVIPSLTTYMDRDLKLLRWVMVLGGLIPLVIYVIWEWFVLGLVPVQGPLSIQSLLKNGQPASFALKSIIKNEGIITFSQVFAFCAVATSYLGVILSLFDFLADGFNIRKEGKEKLLLIAFIFAPPFAFSILFSNVFLKALSYAGSFGCITLFIILPALMAWKSRYSHKIKRPFELWGGKIALISLIALGLCVIFVQFLLTFKVIP